jgi:hypothetical protein
MKALNQPIAILAATLLTLIPICGTSHAAVGGSDGGGGDARCAEFSDQVGRIAMGLMNIGQEDINEVSKVVIAKDLWQIKRSMRCLPVAQLDRQARSNPETLETRLFVDSWAKNTEYGKFRLAAHELAVLARYENDGEYFVSNEIVKILSQKSSEFATLVKRKNSLADTVITNPDGSVTFVNPRALDANGRALLIHAFKGAFTPSDQVASGVCKFFGFKRLIDHSEKGIEEHNDTKRLVTVTTISAAGYLAQTETFKVYSVSVPVFTSVTCQD